MLAVELVDVEVKRTELRAEDKDLELTERVLTRLAQLSYADTESVTAGDAAGNETLAPSSKGALLRFVTGTLAAAHSAWGLILSAVEKEISNISRHPR